MQGRLEDYKNYSKSKGKIQKFLGDFPLLMMFISLLFEKKLMYQLSSAETGICREIVDCAYRIHKELGPGLLEKIYEVCFCHELQKKGIRFERQSIIPIYYDGIYFREGCRLDVFVENLVVCEIKSVDLVNPVWVSQIFSHLKLTNRHVGFLINFNVDLIKNGIRRYCRE